MAHRARGNANMQTRGVATGKAKRGQDLARGQDRVQVRPHLRAPSRATKRLQALILDQGHKPGCLSCRPQCPSTLRPCACRHSPSLPHSLTTVRKYTPRAVAGEGRRAARATAVRKSKTDLEGRDKGADGQVDVALGACIEFDHPGMSLAISVASPRASVRAHVCAGRSARARKGADRTCWRARGESAGNPSTKLLPSASIVPPFRQPPLACHARCTHVHPRTSAGCVRVQKC